MGRQHHLGALFTRPLGIDVVVHGTHLIATVNASFLHPQAGRDTAALPVHLAAVALDDTGKDGLCDAVVSCATGPDKCFGSLKLGIKHLSLLAIGL